MKRICGTIPLGVVPFLLVVVLFSCVEDDYRHIRIDDSTRWEPHLALPVGKGTLDLNGFFQEYSQPETFPAGTTQVFFEGEPYLLAREIVFIEHYLDYSIRQYVDSAHYIQQARLFFRVNNYYPAGGRLQLYLQGDQGEVLDSVFPAPQTIEPGEAAGDNRVREPGRNLLEAGLGREQIDQLFEASGMLVEGRVDLGHEATSEIYLFRKEAIELEVFLRVRLRFRKEDLWQSASNKN